VQVHLKEQGLGGQGALVTEVAMLRGQHVALLRDAQDKKARLNNAGTRGVACNYARVAGVGKGSKVLIP
jgi:hypothetical protein